MARVLQQINAPVIEKVWFEDRAIFVRLRGGQVKSKSIDLYPNLSKGSPQQWQHFELWNDGKWIHWEELDEDLSAEGFLE